MEIDAYELQDILNAAFMKGTSGSCCGRDLVDSLFKKSGPQRISESVQPTLVGKIEREIQTVSVVRQGS